LETTKIFFITFFAALVGVIPPGLINMSVAKTCIERGKKSGIWVAIGASTVVFFQAWIAIQLARYIFHNPFYHNMLLRTGVVIFLLMGIYFFVKARKKKKQIKLKSHGDTRSFFKGAMISVLNVLPIPYFCALGAGLNVSGTVNYNLANIWAFIIAAMLGTFATLYVYAVSSIKILHKTAIVNKYSNYFMAWLMMLLLVISLLRVLLGGAS